MALAIPQTSISTSFVTSLAGQVIFPGQLNEIVSRQVNDSSGIAAGLFVAKGTNDVDVKAPVASTDVTTTAGQGFTVYNPTREPGVYADNEGVPVLSRGYIAVTAASGSYTKGQAVNVRYAGTGTKGSLTQAAVASETAVLPNAQVYETKTLSAAGLVIVKLGV